MRNLLLALLLALGACAQNAAYREGMELIDAGKPEQGLAKLEEATRQDPQNLEYRQALFRQREIAQQRARIEAAEAERRQRREAREQQRRSGEQAARAGSSPQLSAAVRQTITLDFREATLRQIFEAVARDSGLNFIFDRDVRQDARTTIFVRNSTIEDVLRFVLVTNQLERKVLSPNTLLIYPNTAAKLRDYQELVMKSFYLSNADVKATANMIRQMVKTKDMYIDEKLNLLVIRDTPEAIRVAERLIANQDLAEPEVMLEVEVMEISRNNLIALGVTWPSSVSASLVGANGTPGVVTLPELRNSASDLVRLTFNDPLAALNFRQQLDRANLLANPRIRVKNRDKARVHIGDKVPVITTTTTSTGFAAESVSYLDVGLKLEVEPTVTLSDEVLIRIGLEVSAITQQVKSAAGTLTYQVGTRNANTALRLKDGETQVLAGLIDDEDRKSVTSLPGMADLPVLSHLFGSHQDSRNKTEIVLLITPRVIRNIARPEPQMEEFPSGTEAVIGAPPLVLQQSSLEPAAPAAAGATPTRVSLGAPGAVQSGGEFSVPVMLESESALRSGLLDFAYDRARLRFVRAEPGSLLEGASFRANAPEGLGRLNISFTSGADVKGKGELARLTFQLIDGADSAPPVKMEAASLTDNKGQLVSIAR